MNPPPVLDIVGFAVFCIATFFSPQAAAAIGPYLVIVIAAVIGASLSVRRRGRTSRVSAFAFFIQMSTLAVLVTVGVAIVISHIHPELAPRITIAPIAFVIGFLDWPNVANRIAGRVDRAIESDKESS